MSFIFSVETGTGCALGKMEVKIYEELLNSSVRSLYRKGVFNKTKQVTKKSVKNFLKTLQFFKQPFGLGKTLFMEVGLTEAPNFHITPKNGITVNVRVKVRVFTLTANKIRTFKMHKNLFSLSARVTVSGKMVIKGQNLTPKVQCATETRNLMVKSLTGFLVKKAAGSVMIPLPAAVDFSKVNINHFNGYVMVSGCPGLSEAGVRKVDNKLEQLMKKHI